MINKKLDIPNIDIELEVWGVKHLHEKFMFEPMWLDAKNDLKQLINSIVLEVIGEDEEYHRNYTISRVMETRNKLKAEQRQSLKEKLNVN